MNLAGQEILKMMKEVKHEMGDGEKNNVKV